MSRIGKKVIAVPSGVKVSIDAGNVLVEGKAKLAMTLPPLTAAEVKDGQIVVTRLDESRESNAMQGLARSLINNMVIGVTAGFKKELTIVGVGYKAAVSGQKLTLNLGYSHQIIVPETEDIQIDVPDANHVVIKGIDKQKVGQFAAEVRGKRPPEPYKGKGIKYASEVVRHKEGKTGAKK